MLRVGSFSEYANDLKSNDFIGLSRTDCITESRHCSMAGRALKNCASASMKAVKNSKSSSFLIVFLFAKLQRFSDSAKFSRDSNMKQGFFSKKRVEYLGYKGNLSNFAPKNQPFIFY